MRIISDAAKSGLEGGAWIDGYDYQNKDKNITITIYKSPFFHNKTHVISHPVIAAILDVILNISKR